jgi:hypothetical protein
VGQRAADISSLQAPARIRSNCASEAVIPEVVTRGVGQVGEEEEAFAELRGSHGGSAEHTPLRIVPEFGQRSENDIHSSNKQGADIFHEHVSRSYFANDALELEPEPAAVPVPDAFALSGIADVLAVVDNNSISNV